MGDLLPITVETSRCPWQGDVSAVITEFRSTSPPREGPVVRAAGTVRAVGVSALVLQEGARCAAVGLVVHADG